MDHLDLYRERCRQDARTDAELIGIVAGCLADPDDEQYWAAMSVLHGRFGAEAFEKALEWSRSPSHDFRRAAADLLAQAHVGDPSFEQAAGSLLVNMLAQESSPEVLHSLALALGHNGNPGGIPLLVNLRNHSVADVRYGVAHGLAGNDDPTAIAALIELSRDSTAEVRDWATFALGSQTELDTPDIREALWSRVADSDPETRGEALVGLAQRRDHRAKGVIEHLLRAPQVGRLVVEAAEKLPDPSFLEPLRRLKARRVEREEWLEESLDRAIKACGG